MVRKDLLSSDSGLFSGAKLRAHIAQERTVRKISGSSKCSGECTLFWLGWTTSTVACSADESLGATDHAESCRMPGGAVAAAVRHRTRLRRAERLDEPIRRAERLDEPILVNLTAVGKMQNRVRLNFQKSKGTRIN